MVSVKSIDKILSLKLGDPVSDNGDGKIFDKDDRIEYIQRAYSRLRRILPMIMRKEAPLFSKSKAYLVQTLSSAEEKKGNAITIYKDGDSNKTSIIVEDADEVFVKVTGSPTTSGNSPSGVYYNGIVTRINPDKYLSVLNGENQHYQPDAQKKKFYYTFLDNKVYLLPVLAVSSGLAYTQISLVLKADVPQITLESELVIPNEYIDLLITFAANEGMQDIAMGAKVSLYTNDIAGQLAILKGYADLKEAKEGTDAQR